MGYRTWRNPNLWTTPLRGHRVEGRQSWNRSPEPERTPVQLSKAAQATLATLQETTETNAQTVKEASHGDLQAKTLLAKEAAERAPLK